MVSVRRWSLPGICTNISLVQAHGLPFAATTTEMTVVAHDFGRIH